MLKIKHIFHSGFQLEWDDKIILIDVFNHFDQFKNRKMYYLSTHSHSDHYSENAMELRKYNEMTYILSDDIKATGNDVYYVRDGDDLEVDGLKIKVFGTTDLGVSFLINYQGVTVFHSGDLNWWEFPNDPLETREHERDIYIKEVERLVGTPIDYAFVPVDPRLGSGKRYAMDYFITKIEPKYLIPMHFGDNYASVNDLSTDKATVLIIPKEPNSYIL